jgi:N-acetylmuramoyl-L-alanine amidase
MYFSLKLLTRIFLFLSLSAALANFSVAEPLPGYSQSKTRSEYGSRSGLPTRRKKRLSVHKPVRKTPVKRSVVKLVNPRRAASIKSNRAQPKRRALPIRQTINLSLFGSGYSRIPVLSRQLTGAIFYLSSGHGGPDPGAIGRYGNRLLPEDEYAYDVTIRLARLLLQHGAAVYMIVQDRNDGIRDAAVLPIDYDEVAYPKKAIPRNQTARLRQTTTAINQLYDRHRSTYQRFVTIHVDSRSKGETTDVFFYHHPQSKAGQKLAKQIHKRFLANYRQHRPDRPYLGRVTSRGSLYVIRNSHPPTVFIELGNIQNKLDQRRFVRYQNRQALASWLCQGIMVDYRNR